MNNCLRLQGLILGAFLGAVFCVFAVAPLLSDELGTVVSSRPQNQPIASTPDSRDGEPVSAVLTTMEPRAETHARHDAQEFHAQSSTQRPDTGLDVEQQPATEATTMPPSSRPSNAAKRRENRAYKAAKYDPAAFAFLSAASQRRRRKTSSEDGASATAQLFGLGDCSVTLGRCISLRETSLVWMAKGTCSKIDYRSFDFVVKLRFKRDPIEGVVPVAPSRVEMEVGTRIHDPSREDSEGLPDWEVIGLTLGVLKMPLKDFGGVRDDCVKRDDDTLFWPPGGTAIFVEGSCV
eukprot:TRINITY_DN65783_c0_g1_i2.p1 TRINITY_DN65783_c0_g1~~TRINITY_DN65783_c0_g1_i2.p1  ORF type:complete len:292 (+),score=37.84 TRINITY_DN65783_c0_g1_i2:152-1027(+)